MIQRSDINGTVLMSMAAVMLIIIVVLAQLPRLSQSLLLGGVGQGANKQALDDLMSDYSDAVTLYQARFDGRSVFYTPPAPPPPAAPVVQADPTPAAPAPPPPPPPGDKEALASYSGPSIQAIVGETVFFMNGARMNVGDDPRDGIKVVSTEDAPRFARLEYKKPGYKPGEYDVPIFDFNFRQLLAEEEAPGVGGTHRDPPGMTEVPPPAATGTPTSSATPDSTVARAARPPLDGTSEVAPVTPPGGDEQIDPDGDDATSPPTRDRDEADGIDRRGDGDEEREDDGGPPQRDSRTST